jgi:hypothetical protein
MGGTTRGLRASRASLRFEALDGQFAVGTGFVLRHSPLALTFDIVLMATGMCPCSSKRFS